MKARRPLTASELELWRRSTADVQPLKDLQPPEPPSAEPTSAPRPAKPIGKVAKARSTRRTEPTRAKPAEKPTPQALDPVRPIDIDRRNWERLKRGKLEIERTLDLHGRTQSEAHDALDRFLAMASATGLRCVLVVTGKGGRGADGRGVLRQMVPRWLGEAGNRDKVLTYSPAQPRHGGDGALYVLLRRRRDGRVR